MAASSLPWQSDVQDGSGLGIYAQRFGADGVAIGNEFGSTPQRRRAGGSVRNSFEQRRFCHQLALGRSSFHLRVRTRHRLRCFPRRPMMQQDSARGELQLNSNETGKRLCPVVSASRTAVSSRVVSNQNGAFDIYAASSARTASTSSARRRRRSHRQTSTVTTWMAKRA